MPTSTLLPDLQRLLKKLEDDLRRRSEAEAAIQSRLRAQYEAAKAAQRTAAAFAVWRDELVTQIGVAWILGCVFVRFLEDNDFLDHPWISGPGDRRRRAEEQTDEYFREHPIDSETNYLEHVFRKVRELPSMEGLFDERHSPLWQFSPSGDMGRELLRFWRTVDPDSGMLKYEFNRGAALTPALSRPTGEGEMAQREAEVDRGGSLAGGAGVEKNTDEGDSTRFLGDLYQDLSEAARKRFALLQTPIFVEEFILDRTLDPAIATFGLATVRMIDPTCGSGHFLYGAFRRLLQRWQRQEPGTPVRELVQRALDAVHGVDLNPFAVAIARFRLLIAALSACEIARLRHAPAFRIHVAAGDSLLHGPGYEFLPGGVGVVSHHYEVEDLAALQRLLGQRYHAVVGNPPYITVKDKSLNQLYRERFGSCHRKYSLAAPFMELFFYLAVRGDGTPAKPAGQVGMITANSFMKREFGKKLIESFLPGWDLTHVIDTSGAYIPGHGTPTVILFGKNQSPVASTIRAVMGIKGEPTTPEDPARGLVWSAIRAQIDQAGSQSEFLSVADTLRASFHQHPWSIGGGGASELKELLDEAGSSRLGDLFETVGFGSIIGEDEVYTAPFGTNHFRRLPPDFRRVLVEGDNVRDWRIGALLEAAFPYTSEIELSCNQELIDWLWPYRTLLWARRDFSNTTYRESNRPFWEYHQIPVERNRATWLITFAFVATHNHFVLDRGGKVFNRSAPVIKLPAGSTEDDHLAILGLLNSSTACFWMKQVCQPKATAVGDISTERGRPEANRYEFTATVLESFPVPPLDSVMRENLTRISRELHVLAESLMNCSPAAIIRRWTGNRHGQPDLKRLLEDGERESRRLKGRMVLLQEELDWTVYDIYGLLSTSLALDHSIVYGNVEMSKTDRPFNWQEETCPSSVASALRSTLTARYRCIRTDTRVRIIENATFKRPWLGRQGVYGTAASSFAEQADEVVRDWLLLRLEMYFFGGERLIQGGTAAAGAFGCEIRHDSVATLRAGWPGGNQPTVVSTHRLAECARADVEFMQVAELYRKRPDFDIAALVAELVEDEAVPFLPVQRYKESGLRHRRVWEEVWDLQRCEDAVEAEVRASRPSDDEKALTTEVRQRQRGVVGEIPVPPKYKSADFKKTSYWRLRGKLDVPKERWVSLPGCERESDASLPIAWAGWDHLQQAQALAAYLEDLKGSGASEAKQLLVLAGIQQLVPWLLQWHNDVHPEFGMRLGDYFREHVRDELQRLGKTEGDLKVLAYGAGL